MKKVLFSFIMMMIVGLLCAQEVTLEVNLIDGSSVEISGTATLNIQTPNQWSGLEQVGSDPIQGTAFCSTDAQLFVEASSLNEFLDENINIIIDGIVDLPIMNIAVGLPVWLFTFSAGSNPLDVVFYTNGASFEGIDAGTYTATFMFSLVEL